MVHAIKFTPVYDRYVLCILAVMAQNLSTSADASDRLTARRLARTSLWVSVAGIVLGTITIIVTVALMMTYSVTAKKQCEGEFCWGSMYCLREATLQYQMDREGISLQLWTNYCYYWHVSQTDRTRSRLMHFLFVVALFRSTAELNILYEHSVYLSYKLFSVYVECVGTTDHWRYHVSIVNVLVYWSH